MAMTSAQPTPRPAFRHDALLYAGEAEFVATAASFVEDAVQHDEPVLVLVTGRKLKALHQSVGDVGDRVHLTDVAEAGRNPARLIPVWREFLDRFPGRRTRGLGEPIWADRTPQEVVECQRYEALLNVAIAADEPIWLVCTYDTDVLEAAVIDQARCSHPVLVNDGVPVPSTHAAHASMAAHLATPLPEPTVQTADFPFDADSIQTLRERVAAIAAALGMGLDRQFDLEVAIAELTTNSVVHGGGKGMLRVWRELDCFVTEIRDGGHISDPLAGLRLPSLDSTGHRGLWLANQLCDLVQLRDYGHGSVVRVWMRLR